MAARPARLVFLIRALDHGGAERQLLTLTSHLASEAFDVTVVTWYPGGRMEGAFRDRGIRVVSAGKTGRRDLFGFTLRLARLLRRLKPDVVHSYMTGANEMALLLKPVHRAAVVWGVRSTLTVGNASDRLGASVFRVGAWASRWADLIVFNSTSGMEHHVRCGYSRAHAVVIPNGVDTTLFRQTAGERERVRAELAIPIGAPVIGIVGRLDPLKDHETFLRAAAIFGRRDPTARFLVVGGGRPPIATRLAALAIELGVGDRVSWVGDRSDAPALYSALDVLTLTSITEGFPNVVAEAMACGALCVATDVGDVTYIVGDTGTVVPVRSPDAVADAWERIMRMPSSERRALAARARDRIVEEFGAEKLAHRTASALLAAVFPGATPGP